MDEFHGDYEFEDPGGETEDQLTLHMEGDVQDSARPTCIDTCSPVVCYPPNPQAPHILFAVSGLLTMAQGTGAVGVHSHLSALVRLMPRCVVGLCATRRGGMPVEHVRAIHHHLLPHLSKGSGWPTKIPLLQCDLQPQGNSKQNLRLAGLALPTDRTIIVDVAPSNPVKKDLPNYLIIQRKKKGGGEGLPILVDLLMRAIEDPKDIRMQIPSLRRTYHQLLNQPLEYVSSSSQISTVSLQAADQVSKIAARAEDASKQQAATLVPQEDCGPSTYPVGAAARQMTTGSSGKLVCVEEKGCHEHPVPSSFGNGVAMGPSNQLQGTHQTGGCPTKMPSTSYQGGPPSILGKRKRPANDYSALHHEVLQFAHQCLTTPSERAMISLALSALTQVVRSVLPGTRLALFGSQATGLALPGSDLDVVVLDAGTPLSTGSASTLSLKARNKAQDNLEKLNKALKKSKVVKSSQIIRAKVPIIRCEMAVPGHEARVAVDVSFGVAGGPLAVPLIAHQVVNLPPLRPLVLVVKAMLKAKGLNEVYKGGLGSYALVNMVIAHLQCQGFEIEPVSVDEETVEAMTGVQGVEALMRRLETGREEDQEMDDLGELLRGFLRRFGEVFDYQQQAVSILKGGIIQKKDVWKVHAGRLALEDPQCLGRDMGGGTWNIRLVKEAFNWGLKALTQAEQAMAAHGNSPSHGGKKAPHKVQGTFPLLSTIMDTKLQLDRSEGAKKQRSDQAAFLLSQAVALQLQAGSKRADKDAWHRLRKIQGELSPRVKELKRKNIQAHAPPTKLRTKAGTVSKKDNKKKDNKKKDNKRAKGGGTVGSGVQKKTNRRKTAANTKVVRARGGWHTGS